MSEVEKTRVTQYKTKKYFMLDKIIDEIDMKKQKAYDMKKLLKKYEDELETREETDFNAKPTNNLHIMFTKAREYRGRISNLSSTIKNLMKDVEVYKNLKEEYEDRCDKYKLKNEELKNENQTLKKEIERLLSMN
jgi:uncharacterized protein YeeX (DUF496 family)